MLEGLDLALLRRKRLVRFGAQEATFIETPECECLTQSCPLSCRAGKPERTYPLELVLLPVYLIKD
jgi:hypothetical protein